MSSWGWRCEYEWKWTYCRWWGSDVRWSRMKGTSDDTRKQQQQNKERKKNERKLIATTKMSCNIKTHSFLSYIFVALCALFFRIVSSHLCHVYDNDCFAPTTTKQHIDLCMRLIHMMGKKPQFVCFGSAIVLRSIPAYFEDVVYIQRYVHPHGYTLSSFTLSMFAAYYW